MLMSAPDVLTYLERNSLPVRRPSTRTTGLAVAILALIADQLVKLWLIYAVEMPIRGVVTVTPFLDLVMVWNRGVSFGMFSQGWPMSSIPPIALAVLSLTVCTALVWWLASATSLWLAAGIGLVIGGAAGNAIDRLIHGAVADFFLFHWQTYAFWVFNVADAAISVGVAMILIDGFLLSRQKEHSQGDMPSL